jgi:hypothetical protein
MVMARTQSGRWELSIADVQKIRRGFRSVADPNDPNDVAIDGWLADMERSKTLMRDLRAKHGYDEFGGRT